nr:Sec-independent protein translocase subunit TatA [uncultured Cellulomonas sp.]
MNLKPMEILLIVLVILLLFGAKRLPDLARSVGRSLKIFKTEVKDLRDDDRPATSGGATATPAALPDSQHAGTTPPHGDPAVSVLPTDASDRKQV